jgi:phosphonatase-like hydrolase
VWDHATVTNFPSLVIFDMAGTTIEDRGQVPAAFSAALSDAGIHLTADQITRVRGASKRQAIRQLLPASEQSRVDVIYQRFRDELSQRYRADGVRSIGGAADVFARLRRNGARVALTTGFDREITTMLLQSLGWVAPHAGAPDAAIDAAVCGDDVDNGRPSPELILAAMRLTGVIDASQVANIGDTTLDLEAASRAGVTWNIGVLSGAHTRETLEQAPHTHLIASIADLPF